ncbi:FecR family protein [Steroidobacter agaridevorans]|uniref:FecR family protein n=1 Tax=Steroidobacter agaridevorans TaxID=2695856 RepID=UPI001323808B|nr:FecR domain-containing protein [Steroidobacter agaridevorans]GFE85088.1 iron dicitrate transporter FecR [Steroidobacter agaridevorans]
MAPTDRRSRASEEAGEWLLRLQAGELPREQREALVDWLRESPVHVAELLRMASVHGALEQFEHWTGIATSGAEHDDVVVPLIAARQGPAVPAKKRSGARWLAAAGIACIAVIVGFLAMSWRGQVIQTDRGERREVALADGSVVQIDPETRLRVKMDEHSRQIHLDTGRALFRVAKNPTRPFIVHADATTVRAIGTAFGVERRSQGVVVTVAEGKVAVDGPREDGAVQTVESSSGQWVLSGANGIVLVANEQVTLQVAASTPQVRKVDSGRALAWAEGRLIFEDTPVADVVAQFNRYNSIQIQVQDARLAARPVSGVFNAANPEAFIDFIQAGAAVQIRREPGGHIVISSPP